MQDDRVNLENSISEKILRVHMIIVFVVCMLFGIYNLILGFILPAVLVFVAGFAAPVSVTLLKNKLSKIRRGIILSVTQLFVILALSMLKGELANMFPLICGSMALSSIYFDRTNLKIQWITTDAVSLLALLLKDVFYAQNSIEQIIQGFVGMNVAAFTLYYLLKCTGKFINEVQSSKEKTEKLLDKINTQMVNTNALVEEQASVVAQVQTIASSLDSTAGLMEQISTTLSAGAEEQESTISEISKDIMGIVNEASQSLEEAAKSAQAARYSMDKLLENNSEIHTMVGAMNEINDASRQIESIIKTIEDIAFQTNILALNAAVEAARAGAAGKGFAVVADEVRNLATKSAEAAKTTSALIETAIYAVDNGTALASRVAERMNDVIEISEQATEHSNIISSLTKSQVDSINAVKVKIENISYVVSQTSQTSEESAEIARSVSEEVRRMNDIVK